MADLATAIEETIEEAIEEVRAEEAQTEAIEELTEAVEDLTETIEEQQSEDPPASQAADQALQSMAIANLQSTMNEVRSGLSEIRDLLQSELVEEENEQPEVLEIEIPQAAPAAPPEDDKPKGILGTIASLLLG